MIWTETSRYGMKYWKNVFLTIKSDQIMLLVTGMVLWRNVDLKLLNSTFSTMGSNLFSDRLVWSCVDLKEAYFRTFQEFSLYFAIAAKILKDSPKNHQYEKNEVTVKIMKRTCFFSPGTFQYVLFETFGDHLVFFHCFYCDFIFFSS